jgi:N-acetylglucosamine kinase-like BadF-type ATPase
MILIADSGSTKTDWRLIDRNNKEYKFNTVGFNPFFQDSTMIANELNQLLGPEVSNITQTTNEELSIYFYGAGCSSNEKCNIVKAALTNVFPKAIVEVDHDLLAAARSLLGKKEGIAAILGTGSNSCHFNGEKIISNVASLGYILGDEGSGAFIGKHFIQDYLNKDLPDNIAAHFYETYNLSKENILDAVYKQPMPSRFLASFSKFINQHKNENYFVDLIEYNFEQFFRKHICKYEKHRELELSCVGSVAFYYSDILRSVAERKNVTIGKIIESPITDLTSYHLSHT